MEDPCLTVVEEDEDFYERIEAPKFVDFTIPDSSRPDRKSWFCARVGCDQNHEHVDPKELNRSFMLRVMAARSPNVRFQRVLNRQGSRANTKKCPQSAPPKSIKNGISRITEKITVAKLKQHPIASLSETPIQKRIKVQTLAGEKEQNTTGNKKSQAKCLKTSDTVVLTKDKNLVKALFSHTPKKAASSKKAPISEICSEKKKINTKDERKRMTQCSNAMSSNKCKGSSSAVGSKNRNHNILKQAKHNDMRDAQIGIVSNGSDHVEKKNANLVKPAIKVLKVDNEIKAACNAMNEDDKENTLFTFENKIMCPNAATSEVKSLQFQNSIPQEAKVQNKAFQVAKLTRTTNPKPFRLRTDERGILKEANLERKLQVESKKEPAMLLKHIDGIQIQETNSQAKLAKTTQTHMLNSKIMQGSHCKSSKMASSKQLPKITSATKERKESISRMFKEKRGLSKPADKRAVEKRRAGDYLHGRKPTTIPKEPKFHRIHVPKNCIRRFEMVS